MTKALLSVAIYYLRQVRKLPFLSLEISYDGKLKTTQLRNTQNVALLCPNVCLETKFGSIYCIPSKDSSILAGTVAMVTPSYGYF